MIGKRPRYTDEFQRAVVKAVQDGGKVVDVALAHGISVGSVHNWIKRFSKETPGEKGPIKRRRQFSDEEKLRAVELVATGMSVIEAADVVGATTRSIYDWMLQLRPELHRERREAGKIEADRAAERLRLAEAQRLEAQAESERLQAEQLRAQAEEAEHVKEMVADPITWMQKYTKTKDSHWREHGADSPYRRLPEWPYFRVIFDDFQREVPYFVEKSRDMLVSWTVVGIFTHAAMTTEGIDVIFQSQKQEKANELVEYAKILYDQSEEAIKRAYPLARKVQAENELAFANGSRIIAIPGGGDQIRSYHPWGLLMDEAAFMPEAGEAFDTALSVCKKIAVVSSAGPGWFADYVSNCEGWSPGEREISEAGSGIHAAGNHQYKIAVIAP